MSDNILLDVKDLHHRYGDRVALDGFSLALVPGEICALVGRNGAGKSTLAGVLTGLLRPQSGIATLDGETLIESTPSVRARVGYASQELALYQPLTGRENLATFGELYGLRGNELLARIDEVSVHFALGHLLDRPVHRLSGGEQRRIHSAAAVLHRPRLILLDEPTAGVDVQTRSQILRAVRALAATEGSAVLYATHYLDEVAELGATVSIIDAGRVLARGEVEDLVLRHASPAIELGFRGPAPEVSGAIVDGSRLHISCERPLERVPSLLRELGANAQDVVDIQLIAPDLQGVYLALSGARLEEAA